MPNLKERLMNEIHSGKVAMTPRSFFTLKFLLVMGTALTILFVSVFLFNFIFFSIRISGGDTLLTFGPRGFGAFIHFFPWPFLIIDSALILLLQKLVRHFRFGYTIPTLYLIGGLILSAAVVGFLVDYTTPLNERIHERRAHLPRPVGQLYDRAHREERGSGMCRCTILAIEGAVLTVQDTRDATTTLTVILPQDNRRATTTGLKVGDVLFIAGEEQNGVIEAYGVRKVTQKGRQLQNIPTR